MGGGAIMGKTLIVYRYLRRMKNTSPGTDRIPVCMPKDNGHLLAEPICHIFSTSLSSGLYPAAYKVSKIMPSPKCNNPSTMKDMRPIALTSIIQRTFDRMVSFRSSTIRL